MLRSIGSVVAGVVAGGLLVALVEKLGHLVYPPPEGLDSKDLEAMKEFVATLPVGAFLFVLLAWAVGSLGGGWLAAKIAARKPLVHALIVGGVLMIGGILTLVTIPHPLWFTIVGVLVFLPAACAGAKLAAA